MVKTVGQLLRHFSDLADLFKEDDKYLRLIQCDAILKVLYIFGDESGSGFGTSWTEGIFVGYRFGVRNEEGYGTISNYRQFWNLVEILEEVGKK